MTAGRKKPRPVRSQADYWDEMIKWMGKAQSGHLDWDTTLQDLQAFILNLFGDIEERQQQTRIIFFEKSAKELLRKFAGRLTKIDEIRIHLRLAKSFETLGAWQKALATYQEAISLCDTPDTIRFETEALRWIGHIYCMRSEWRQANEAYQHSLRLSREQKDIVNEACATSSLGILAFEQGEIDRAAEHFEQGLALADKAGDLKLTAEIYNNLGAVENVRGKWADALAIYNKSLPVLEKLGETRTLAEIYHNIAMTYADMQRWADAGANYQESYALAKACGDLRLQATVKLNRAELYLVIGDFGFAGGLCHQALKIFQRLQDRLGEADAYKFLGMISTARREWQAARRQFSNSIRLAKKYNSPMAEAESHFELGKMWQQKGNAGVARKQLELALAQFTRLQADGDVAKVKKVLENL